MDGNAPQRVLHKDRRFAYDSAREEKLPGGFACEPGVNCVRAGRKGCIRANSECRGLEAKQHGM